MYNYEGHLAYFSSRSLPVKIHSKYANKEQKESNDKCFCNLVSLI